jgi:HEAT repeat protein
LVLIVKGDLVQDEYDAAHWLEQLRDEDEDKRWRAVDAIRHLLPLNSFISSFMHSLKNAKAWVVRALICHSFYDAAHRSEERSELLTFTDEIIDALLDQSIEVRLNVIYTLELLGADAQAALPVLDEMLSDDNERIRTAASEAIHTIRLSQGS